MTFRLISINISGTNFLAKVFIIGKIEINSTQWQWPIDGNW